MPAAQGVCVETPVGKSILLLCARAFAPARTCTQSGHPAEDTTGSSRCTRDERPRATNGMDTATTSLAAVRHRLLRLVSHRNYFYVTGLVPPEKAVRVAQKFAGRRYSNHVHRVWFFDARENQFRFWLLTTKAEHLLYHGEAVRDARRHGSRITLANLEIKRLERHVRHPGGHREPRKTWTWGFTQAAYSRYEALGRRLAAHRDPRQGQDLIEELVRLPGFSGVRFQRKALYARMRDERARRQPQADTFWFPGRQPWVNAFRAPPDEWVPLAALGRKHVVM